MKRAFVLATLAVVGCDLPPQPPERNEAHAPAQAPAPARIDINERIEASTDDGRLLAAGEASKRALANIQEELRPGTQAVRLHFSLDDVDRLGNPISVPMFRLAFPAADVRRANFANLSGPDVLDLATEYFPASVEGAAAVNRSCSVQGRGQISERLCQLRDSIPAN